MKFSKAGMPNRMTSVPVAIPRTARNHPTVVLTSTMPGKVLPVAVIPLLREDKAQGGVSIALEMKETVEILMNDVNVVAQAWLVPTLASDRFRTMDDIDLSYTGNAREGDAVVPYVEHMPFKRPDGALHQIHYRLGKHAPIDAPVNAAYTEAYNLVWNYRAQNISPNIELRDRLQTDLAQAFWPQNSFSHVKADFDASTMEGEVNLTVVDQKMPIKGLRIGSNGAPLEFAGRDTTNDTTPVSGWAIKDANNPNVNGQTHAIIESQAAPGGGYMPHIYAMLKDDSLTVSLANIRLAQQTQEWAATRKRYNMLDEMLIDILMDGMNITEQGWRQPILLDENITKFGMAKRYAADGASLTESVVNGGAALDLRWATPQVPCGGVIIVTLEIAPEQLFERQADPYFLLEDADRLPHAMPDIMRPQKVDVVKNGRVDIDHDTPDDVLGYEEMNARWNHAGPNIGGAYYRPEVDAPFDSERQSIWAVETKNPTLTKDFYLVPADIHLKPFVTSLVDPFRVIVNGHTTINGLTQFGGALIESTRVSDYNEVLKRVDTTRIEKP